MNILEEAREVLRVEAAGIERLIPTLDQRFVNAVKMIRISGTCYRYGYGEIGPYSP